MKSNSKSPYQKLMLRILHNLQGLSVILAVITAFWTYNTYDGRWGKIAFLPDWKEIEGIHGTFGLWVLLILPIFIIYSIHKQAQKLIQKDSLDKLKLINKPIWWYSLHRLVNTFSIFALVFAVFSGKMMDEKWLPQGELNHYWYYLHLISLIIVVLAIAFHVLTIAKIGSFSFLLSIFKLDFREDENPKYWLNKIKSLPENYREIMINEWTKTPVYLKISEIVLIFTIILAWIISWLK
ncbi:cytochrome b/b6 domain-containing protein [Cyanobacterium aponinum AL20118]|uniref:Cytochrome b/b6 domain-containing protein n=1 Tax=Cyanobacterium aponinum AL20115 TaxID=3090662 RepID=A0AAF0ZG40_9CHRO|nr:cytochrome b/b6 domain-containing protein [Cyanobacterium aponinum]WPF89570.1 cytochrome b/b6 domain-containing protein [Cyanobacterium aponinum AL20115]